MQKKYMMRDSFTFIYFVETNSWLHAQHFNPEDDTNNPDMSEPDKDEKINNHTLPCVSKNLFDEDVFKIVAADINEIWETNFLISCS